MKLAQKDLGDDLELDMSPMIDMVFLLLIFFIVASQIIDEKPKVEIPTASYAKVPDDTTGRLMITVNIVNDQPVYYVGPIEMDDGIEGVKERIKQEIDADPELRVLVRGDGAVPYKYTEKIMNACAEVGAQDLIFSAFEE